MAARETIVVVKQPRTNRDGDIVAAGAELEAKGCKIWPRTNEEGEVVIEGLNVFVPEGQPWPESDDVVRARGGVYEVIATPGHFMGKGRLVTLSKAGATSVG